MNLFNIVQNWIRVRILRKNAPGLFDERDPRNFGAKVIAGAATEEDLVSEDFFTFLPPALINQASTDFCVGCSKAYAKGATEGVQMSWAGAFAMAMQMQGFISEFGTSILQMMKAAVKYGIPEESFWPYGGNRNYSADWRNMPKEVTENAAKHKDGSFFEVQLATGMDQFDTFRAYLWKLRRKKIAIQTGADAHAITLVGQKIFRGELRLYGPDSYGPRSSVTYRLGVVENGYRHFTRPEVNQMFTGYVGLDMQRSLAELLVRYDGKAIKLEEGRECFLVKGGMKLPLRNEAIAWAHNTLLFGENFVFVVTPDEFESIPLGEPATFESGPNHEIIRRVLEKVAQTHLINA